MFASSSSTVNWIRWLFYSCISLGGRTPTAMLQHMSTLQPGEKKGILFHFIFVNLLEDVVREVVSSMDNLDDMAATATAIYETNASASVSSLTLDDDSPAQVNAVRRPVRQHSGRGDANSTGNPRRRGGGFSLCKTHSRYGREAFKCDRPGSCPMRDVTKSPPSGNGPAGRA